MPINIPISINKVLTKYISEFIQNFSFIQHSWIWRDENNDSYKLLSMLDIRKKENN